MKKLILILFIIFPLSASAQFTREEQIEIDLAVQTDSVDITIIPAHCVIEYCAMIVDTTIVNAGIFSIVTRAGQDTLLTWTAGETDIIAVSHATSPNAPTGAAADTVALHYTFMDEPATGRVRVYVRWIEMF